MVKLIDILREITEGKQIGNLYHFTYSENIPGIFKKGLRFAPDNSELPKYKDMFYISTTRSHTAEKFFKDDEYTVRITLDGNKISETYPVKPISVENIWLKNGGLSWGKNRVSAKDVFYEERIWSSKEGYLDPKYIIKIDTIVPESEIRRAIEQSKSRKYGGMIWYDEDILKYIDNGKLNFVKNFNSK